MDSECNLYIHKVCFRIFSQILVNSFTCTCAKILSFSPNITIPQARIKSQPWEYTIGFMAFHHNKYKKVHITSRSHTFAAP